MSARPAAGTITGPPAGARKRTLASARRGRCKDFPSRRLPGGALDGIKEPEKCFVIRGGGEMENHFECLRDLFGSIPSLRSRAAAALALVRWRRCTGFMSAGRVITRLVRVTIPGLPALRQVFRRKGGIR